MRRWRKRGRRKWNRENDEKGRRGKEVEKEEEKRGGDGGGGVGGGGAEQKLCRSDFSTKLHRDFSLF